MSDLAPDHELAPRADAAEALGDDATLVEQWSAAEDAGRVVAMLAGRGAPAEDVHAAVRIGMLARAPRDRSGPARAALGELVATMRAGLDALLAVHGTTANTQAAATRLWHEYDRGRAQVLAEAASALAR